MGQKKERKKEGKKKGKMKGWKQGEKEELTNQDSGSEEIPVDEDSDFESWLVSRE